MPYLLAVYVINYMDISIQGPGIRLPLNEQQEELSRLKKEVSELKMERNILKSDDDTLPYIIHKLIE